MTFMSACCECFGATPRPLRFCDFAERQRKVSAQVAKAKQTARAKQDAEHDFRRQSFLEAMRHAGVPEADFDAVMSQSTARMYLGVVRRQWGYTSTPFLDKLL